VRTRNCYCGLVAHANCTRCGQGVCSQHHRDSEHNGAWFYRNYGQGKTLGDAAYVRGYWSAPSDRFLCKGCRARDGQTHRQQVLAQSRKWKRQDPFGFALTAATKGYVIAEPAISYPEVVRTWLQLNWQPVEVIFVPRLRRPAKLRRSGLGQKIVRPAEYVNDRFAGWSFPHTVLTHGENMHGISVSSWSDPTTILTNGQVLHSNKPADLPLTGHAGRLIVEMGRKMFLDRGMTWTGPMENWDT
jgi:hypothetical protein